MQANNHLPRDHILRTLSLNSFLQDRDRSDFTGKQQNPQKELLLCLRFC